MITALNLLCLDILPLKYIENKDGGTPSHVTDFPGEPIELVSSTIPYHIDEHQ